MKSYKMWIGGEWVEAQSGKTYTVVNPATEEKIAQVPLGDKADVDKAVKAARKAFPVWSKKPQAERSRILNKLATSLRKHVEELAQIDMLDHGSPAKTAHAYAGMVPIHFETSAESAKDIMGIAELRPTPTSLPYLQREPIGVCGEITSWNIPLMVSAKIAAALATGNTCVMKAPSVDSLPGLRIAEILAEEPELPAGAANLITGPGSTAGEALSSHPDVDMIAFTGSSETGKAIMAAASGTTKRLFLELGGKNPFIVLEDADFDAAIAGALYGAFNNTGMICVAPGRYYVHNNIYDKFVERFIQEAKKVVVGNPSDPRTTMGPVVSAEHRDKIEKYFKIGVAEGAKLVLGGKRPAEPPLNKGFFVMPTVFTEVTQNMTIAREEIFGPVACFMRFSSEDEVIDMANDNIYGLCSYVCTKSLAKSLRFANALHSGSVRINTNMGGGLPWGGFKQSGFGKEGFVMGLLEYTQVKSIVISQ